MTDSNQSEPTIVTDVKVKDPRRVAAGKRLGAISRQAKEAKALRSEQQIAGMNSESNENTLYLVGGLVVVGAVSYLLFLSKE